MIALGHGPNDAGGYDPGYTRPDGVTESDLLLGDFQDSLESYIAASDANIELYDQNMVANEDAENYTDFDTVT